MTAIETRIRPAVAEDQKLIRAVIRQARLNPLGLHWRSFVIAEDLMRDFLGCAQIKSHKDGSRELASLYVKPEHRGRGIGSLLIRYLQDQERSSLWLTCRSGLVPLYERFGFLEICDATVMPLYFRRVWQLFHAFSRWSPQWEALAVMWWDASGVKE